MAKLSEAKRQSKFLTSGKLMKFSKSRSEFGSLEGVDKILAELIAKYYYSPDGSSLAQKELKRVDAVASGNLIYQGLLPEVRQSANGYVIEFHLNRDTPYWKTIEQGMKKHIAFPYENIQLWIQQKPNVQSRLAEFMTKNGIKKVSTARKSLAYLISKKIWDKGIRAKTDFFTRQHDPFLKELKSKLPKALGDSIKLTILDAVKKK